MREVHGHRLGRAGAAELGQQLAGRRSLQRVRIHRGGDQPVQRGLQPGEVRRVVHDPVEDRLGPAHPVWRTSGRGEGDRRAPGVDVNGRADRPAPNLFGGEIAGRAHDEPAARQCRHVGGGGEAEVDDVRLTVQHEDVAGGEVTVDHVGRMQRSQGVGEAAGHLVQIASRQRTGRRDEVVEAPPGDETRNQVGHVGIDVRVEHLDQMGAADATQRLQLVAEPGARR